jgi:hypothetical protein
MTLRKAIDVLTTFQRWSLDGEDNDIQNPSVVNEAIKTLLDFTDSPEFFAIESKQLEITDADIKKCMSRYNITDFGQMSAFVVGAKWVLEKIEINNKSYSLTHKL